MPQIVEFNGSRIEFPDGMPAAEIETALKKNALSIPPAPAKFEDPGALMSGVIAAGRGTDQLVKGAQQLFYKATGNKEAENALALEVQDNNDAYKPLATARPWSTGIGELLPSAALMVGTGGGGALAMMGKSALASAAPSALEYGTIQERIGRGVTGAVGGAAGAGLGLGLARVLKPAGAGAPAVSNEAMGAAERLGYRPTPAQITQNPFLGNLENFFSKNPGSSGAMQALSRANQTALNRAGAKSMGEATSDLGETTFAAAKSRIGDEFTRLSVVTKPQLGDDFLNSLGTIDAANKARGPFMNKNVDGLIEKGLDLAATGKVSGQAYKEIRTELANQAQTAFKGGDATTGAAYKAVVEALDDAAKSSLSTADKKAWDTARQQWGAYKTLSKGNVAEAGDVSAARVASVVRRNSDGLRTGSAQGELADIARLGEAFKGVQNPNSGNLVNQLAYQNMLGPFMMAGNKAASAAYLSPAGRHYFTKGLLDIGAGGERGLMRAGGLLATPATRSLLGVE